MRDPELSPKHIKRVQESERDAERRHEDHGVGIDRSLARQDKFYSDLHDEEVREEREWQELLARRTK